MSNVNAIKTFRDLLSFLTIIPVGAKEDFVLTSAEHLYLFPLIGGFIGLLGATYFLVAKAVVSGILWVLGVFAQVPADFVLQFVPAATTVAFVLVLTGLQHFDGLVDLGNALGRRSVHERKMVAHAWTVTHYGAFLALTVEAIILGGLFFLNPIFTFVGIILAEVAAKLAMVTIVWIGKPTHKGLGSIFLTKAKKKLNIVACAISALIVYPIFGYHHPLLGLLAIAVMLAIIPVAILMEKVAENIFGGVSGDMIGATNEVARAVSLFLLAVLLMFV